MAGQQELISGPYFEFQSGSKAYRLNRRTNALEEYNGVSNVWVATDDIESDAGEAAEAQKIFYEYDTTDDLWRKLDVTTGTPVLSNISGTPTAPLDGDGTGIGFDPNTPSSGTISEVAGDIRLPTATKGAHYINSSGEIITIRTAGSELFVKVNQINLSDLSISLSSEYSIVDKAGLGYDSTVFRKLGDDVYILFETQNGSDKDFIIGKFNIETFDYVESAVIYTINTAASRELTMEVIGSDRLVVLGMTGSGAGKVRIGGMVDISGATPTIMNVTSGTGASGGLLQNLSFNTTRNISGVDFRQVSPTLIVQNSSNNAVANSVDLTRYTIDTTTGNVTVTSEKGISSLKTNVYIKMLDDERTLYIWKDTSNNVYGNIFREGIDTTEFSSFLGVQLGSQTGTGDFADFGPTSSDNVTLIALNSSVFKVVIPSSGISLGAWPEVTNPTSLSGTTSKELSFLSDGRAALSYNTDLYVVTL